MPGLLDLSALWQLYHEAERQYLKDPRVVPATHPRLRDGERSIFSVLDEGDVLVHHLAAPLFHYGRGTD